MDKIQELDERLEKLEIRLKSNFLEIERRFTEIYQQAKMPENIDERFNELEDLILLLQVENTKVKEKLTGGLGFGAETDVKSINERINEVEERMSEISTAREPIPPDLMEKINMIEEHINTINETKARLGRLEIGPEERVGRIGRIEEGARRIEEPEPRIMPKIKKKTEEEEEEIILPSKSLLSEVNEILEGG